MLHVLYAHVLCLPLQKIKYMYMYRYLYIAFL